ALLLVFAKELYFIAYDEEVAKKSGIKVKFLNFLHIICSVKGNRGKTFDYFNAIHYSNSNTI
ncbi:MAG: metal ABC transporter permease, partial [Rickettsiales bacterium]|nr:metal ABC transporter permease [Rickettsiales bacterium]